MVTDEQLIAATLAGDHRAFQTLVEAYEPRVAATVIGMLGRCPEAEDVGQETFIRFYRSLRDFQALSSVATYVTRIAINLSLNELKRRKRRSLFSVFPPSSGPENNDPVAEIPDPRATAGYNDTKEIVHRALGRLDPKFRAVIVLRLLEGYSTQETADILQVPVGTVLSRLSRAQQKLKILLGPHFGAQYEQART